MLSSDTSCSQKNLPPLLVHKAILSNPSVIGTTTLLKAGRPHSEQAHFHPHTDGIKNWAGQKKISLHIMPQFFMGQITIESHQNGNPYVMCLPLELK